MRTQMFLDKIIKKLKTVGASWTSSHCKYFYIKDSAKLYYKLQLTYQNNLIPNLLLGKVSGKKKENIEYIAVTLRHKTL